MTPGTEPTDRNEGEPAAEARPMPRRRGPRRLPVAVRGVLVFIAVGWLAVFGVAAWLNPYRTDDGGGGVRSFGTHQQLGLPPCGFMRVTGRPCPSCGMTTSFSLMLHADPINAARANWVGVLLVVYGMVMVPWAIHAAWRGRYLWVRSLESVMLWTVIVFLVLVLSRWVVVLLYPVVRPETLPDVPPIAVPTSPGGTREGGGDER